MQGVITPMSPEPPIKLFDWKRAILLSVLGVGVVAFRTYQAYRAKGFLDGTDILVASLTIAMFCGILAFVRWWANRP
jgi:hypothetical protein